MRLLVVIVNYKVTQLTINCLHSLADEITTLRECRVQVVDNASGDGSVERLRAAIASRGWGSWAAVLPMEHNGGFAFGNNAAIRHVQGDHTPSRYVLLLNPDTIVKPRAVIDLVQFMDAHPQAGIAGSRVEDADGRIQRSAHRSPTPLGELEAAARLGALSRLLWRYAVSPPTRCEPHECDWVSGAAMIIRWDVFEKVGLLDEKYFLYYDEVDFCCRARRKGWEVWYVPQAHVVHFEGASTGIRERTRRPAYWFQSRRRFFVKHHGVPGLLLADGLWLLGWISLWLRRLLRLGGDHAEESKWSALDVLWGDCKALFIGDLDSHADVRGPHA